MSLTVASSSDLSNWFGHSSYYTLWALNFSIHWKMWNFSDPIIFQALSLNMTALKRSPESGATPVILQNAVWINMVRMLQHQNSWCWVWGCSSEIGSSPSMCKLGFHAHHWKHLLLFCLFFPTSPIKTSTLLIEDLGLIYSYIQEEWNQGFKFTLTQKCWCSNWDLWESLKKWPLI